MKKIFLTLLAFSVISLGAVSCSDKNDSPKNPDQTEKPGDDNGDDNNPGDDEPGGPESPSEGLSFGYCGDVALAMGNEDLSATTGYAAIIIPEAQAQQWKGSTLSAINVGFGYSSSDEVTVFLADDLNGEPFYSQTAKVTTQNGWNLIKLDTPYEVAGSQFVAGYSTPIKSSNDKPIGFDNIKSDNVYGGWVNLYNEWDDMAKYWGDVCVRILLTGDNLPQYNVEAESLELPELVETGQPFDATLYVTNNGMKTIKELTVNVKVGGFEVENPKTSLPNGQIASGETGEVLIEGLVASKSGSDLSVTVTIVTVNGEADLTPEDNTTSSTFSTAEKLYKRNVVVEEFTGTWCGNCPVGIVAMAYMREKYGNQGFIGIAGHYGDEMQVASYVPVVERYGVNAAGSVALPASTVNRIQNTYPAIENLEYYYLAQSKYPTFAAVTDLKADYDAAAASINVSSTAEFSFDYENAKFALAFVIIEDDFGPFSQTNYFSGGTGSDYLEGWSNKPGHVETYFNEVVRDIEKAFGIGGSIPSTIKGQTPVSYSTSLSTVNIENVKECEVVALLLDTGTGEIINAAKTKIND